MNTNIFAKIKYLCPLAYATNEDFECAMSRADIIKIQNDISAKIFFPTSVLQFKETPDGCFDRIDSQSMSIRRRITCNAFQTCAAKGEVLCKKSDSSHAILLKDLNYMDFFNGDAERKVKRMSNEMNEPLELICDRQPYISYECSMLGYRELIFPIFAEGVVVGVLLVGQIELESREKSIVSAKKKFFGSNSNLFNDYINLIRNDAEISEQDKRGKYSKKGIEKFIINYKNREDKISYEPLYIHTNIMSSLGTGDVLNNNQYSELVVKIQNCIMDFQNDISYAVGLRRDSSIQRVIACEIDRFAEEPIQSNINPFEAFWKNAGRALKNIVLDCGLMYIAIFGSKYTSEDTESELRICSFEGARICENAVIDVQPELNKFFADALKIMETYSKPFYDMEYNMKEQFETSVANHERKSAIFFPVNQTPKASLIVLIDYGSRAYKESVQRTLKRGLQPLIIMILSKLIAIIEHTNQMQYYTTLRMYRHEAVHLGDALRLPLDEYWDPESENFKRCNRMVEKYRDIYKDAKRTLDLMGALSSGIDVLIKGINSNKEDIPVFKDIIYKWREIYNRAAYDRYMKIVIPKVQIADGLRDYVYCDRKLLEVMVYNIFANAMKYSYKGTNIYIDCAKEHYGSHPVLTITDFGYPISKSDEIYELYYRSSIASDRVPGSGIGLYIVKMAAKAANLEVRHFSEKVSDYNVPMLWLYTVRNESNNETDSVLYKMIKKEKERLDSSFIDTVPKQDKLSVFHAIIADTLRSNICGMNWNDIKDELMQPTYQVTFEVML